MKRLTTCKYVLYTGLCYYCREMCINETDFQRFLACCESDLDKSVSASDLLVMFCNLDIDLTKYVLNQISIIVSHLG
jgi:hypothetical protein